MIFVKLQNGAYVLVREDNYESSYYGFLVGMVALRSPKNTLVVTGNEDPSDLLFNLEEKKLHFDKIAIALGRSLNDTQKRRLAKLYGLDSEAAVIYNGKSDCEKALQCALQMSYTEICKKRDVLKNMYETLVQQAEQTIKNILLNTSDS